MRGLTSAEAGDSYENDKEMVRVWLFQLRDLINQINAGGDSPEIRGSALNLAYQILGTIPENEHVAAFMYSDRNQDIKAYSASGYDVWDAERAARWAGADEPMSYR